MKVHLTVNGEERGTIEVPEDSTGNSLAKSIGAPLPVTILKVNGRFTPLPERLKEGDRVELFITSSSG